MAGDDEKPAEPTSARVRLPGFVNDEDIGLGDVVKRVSRATGIRPCRGCGQRAETLNRWLVFSGRSGSRRREV
ncbi:hypothetical protein FDA94_11505 [Herbidospora galbida]|uniref:Uncharacterized protein n=2 Tax=Herbidospora galbida TaxID=2575442 RepID=A0A4U3MI44_9ACTN|nr:hypothetical protein FDA94_11505 [Herbidospora galbida]